MERADDRHSAHGASEPPAVPTRAPRAPLTRVPARVRCLIALGLVTLASAIACAPALALTQQGHKFAFSFGESKCTPGALGCLVEAAGMAINESTGTAYVVDAGNQSVDVFHFEGSGAEGKGTAIEVWGFGVANGEEKFERCTASCQPGKAGTHSAEGQFDYPEKLKRLAERTQIAIAVDNSPGSPSKGDVYVVSNTKSAQNVVAKFSEKGEFLGLLPLAAIKTVGGVSVDASGRVWVQGAEQGAELGTGSSKEEEEEITETHENALDEMELVERFSNATTNTLENTVHVEENEELSLSILCPTAGIGIDATGARVYLNHELRGHNVEECFYAEKIADKEFNAEHKTEIKEGKLHALSPTETPVTAKLRIKEEEHAEPILSELESLPTVGIAVDQTTGHQTSGNVYLDNQSSVAAFNSAGAFVQRFGTEHLKDGGGAGIAFDNANGDVFVVDYKKGLINVWEPEQPGRPIIDALSAHVLEETTVELKALIDPHGSKLTEGYFEYGPEPCPGGPNCKRIEFTPQGIEGFGDQEVTAVVSGLAPATTYYYRVEAVNEKGSAEIAKEVAPPIELPQKLQTFSTLPNATEGLPDHRAWELVSEPDKHGASAEAIGGIGGNNPPSIPIIQASEDGEAITYGVNAPAAPTPEGDRAPETQQEISRRSAQGWSTHSLVTPTTRAQGIPAGEPEEYRLFSVEDLSQGLLRPPGIVNTHLQEPPLVNGLTEEQLGIYLRHTVETNCLEAGKHCFEPLITSENAPGAEQFGGILNMHPLGASPNLEHIVFRSKVPLLKRAGEEAKAENVYEWNAAGKQLKLVNVLPDGAVHEGHEEEPSLGIEGKKLISNTRNTVSRDGTRVIWSEAGKLYSRNMETGKTLELNKPEIGLEETSSDERLNRAVYQDASIDGTKIFFTDTAPLTKTSTLHPHAEEEEAEFEGSERQNPTDLYVCEINESEECKLTDLTAGCIVEKGECKTVHLRGEVGESADLTKQIPGVDEKGETVYFVANGALAPGAIRGNCATQHQTHESASAECNLYVEHFNGKAWDNPKTIAVLSQEDAPDWGAHGTPEGIAFPETISYISSRVSPNGQFFAFMSKRQLTGKNNEDAVANGTFDQEVFLYDFAHERLVCASCKSTQPRGVLDKEDAGEGIGLRAERPGVWRGERLAASIPTWTMTIGQQALYQSRYLTNEGRLFFNSPDQLVPMPSGESYDFKENVYEYELPGLPNDTCTASAGCVALISSGTSNQESSFLDASTDGGNVFFVTNSKLVAGDEDTGFKIYDARICTEASPCIKSETLVNPAACESTKSCKGSGPIQSNFEVQGPSGTGNVPKTIVRGLTETKPKPKAKKPTRAQLLAKALASCRKRYKHNKHRRASCERSARHRYAPKAKKKSHKAAHQAARRGSVRP